MSYHELLNQNNVDTTFAVSNLMLHTADSLFLVSPNEMLYCLNWLGTLKVEDSNFALLKHI